ncbi:alpha/beta hydrolase [Imhoffiella purpurea]|uniref:Hydrolase, alpha/beta superfamily n=1 Tax=Imhoffiella purpurea TaxID=1249627 RepID=W9V3Y0_9GAMM|nr:alpha/beta fold hydrolase [Imhoffiella purpurea]EXJ14039.1 Hydrolase, alpha/beta superfamily [Imhoffiella purpurea]
MNALLLTSAILVAMVPLTRWAVHRAYRAPRIIERGTPADVGLPYRPERIPTVNGRHLFAWLVPAAAAARPAPAVIVLHGWGGNAEDMLVFASVLHRADFAVLLLDARNHGRSDGDEFSSLPRFAEDLEHGLDWLRREPGVDPERIALLGHSVGAAAALLVAARRREPAAVVSVAAFAHPADLMGRQMRAHRIPEWPLGRLLLRYIEHRIGAEFDTIAPCNSIRALACPALLIHGEADDRVPCSDARRIHAARRDDRTELLIIPGVGHDSRDAVPRHAEALVAFLRRAMGEWPRRR